MTISINFEYKNGEPRLKAYSGCEKCGKESPQGLVNPENGWYEPYYMRQKDGSVLQTQLCPNCCPKLSIFMWTRKHPNARFLNEIYAHLFGYFWLPCRGCGRYFGGHEKHGKGTNTVNGSSWITCANC